MRDRAVIIVVLAILISFIGILSIYSCTHNRQDAFLQLIYRRQILWVIFGMVLFAIISNINYRRLWDWNHLLYGLVLFCLSLVFILGVIRLGAQRWLKIAWFNFQPSEFAKLIIIIFLARYYSRKSISDISLLSAKFGIFRGLILPFIFVIIPVGLVVEQPDLGSGAIILLLFIAMLFFTEIKLKYILAFLSFILISLPLFWHFLRDYQKERLLVFINPNIDPLGAGYTIIQSKIAIGSGGFFGKGWLAGTQSQLYFLPEAHTDFIFASFAEQWGFVGSMILLVLYFILIREGFLIAQRTRDYFGKLLAFGITIMLAIQICINIAMNLGLAPVVGLPLPLMSYGGSSLTVTFISLGILVSVDKRRAVF